MKKYLSALALVTAPTLVMCGPIPVEVVATANDAIGGRMLFLLREALATSRQFTTSIADDEPRVRIFLVSMDSGTTAGTQASYSFVMTHAVRKEFAPTYDYNVVGLCTRDVVQQCADSLVARVANQYAQFYVNK